MAKGTAAVGCVEKRDYEIRRQRGQLGTEIKDGFPYQPCFLGAEATSFRYSATLWGREGMPGGKKDREAGGAGGVTQTPSGGNSRL